MANIRVDVGFTIKDGCDIAFKAPCDASAVTGLTVYYPNLNGVIVSQSFTFKDANCNNIGNINNLFKSGALIKATLDTENNSVYIQNADTNAYLERRFGEKLDISGGIMTDNLMILKDDYPDIKLRQQSINREALFEADNYGNVWLASRNGDGESSALILATEENSDLTRQLELRLYKDSAEKRYKFYGEHNKPTPSDIGAAASSHNHSATNITSGTLSAARGGTGQTTVTPAVGTKGVRQIYAGTTDMTASSTSLTTGVVYLVYQ